MHSDLDAADRSGKQPLHVAAVHDKSGAASELLESGAAMITLRKEDYKLDLRETLMMAGAEAVGSDGEVEEIERVSRVRSTLTAKV